MEHNYYLGDAYSDQVYHEGLAKRQAQEAELLNAIQGSNDAHSKLQTTLTEMQESRQQERQAYRDKAIHEHKQQWILMLVVSGSLMVLASFGWASSLWQFADADGVGHLRVVSALLSVCCAIACVQSWVDYKRWRRAKCEQKS